MLGLHDPAGRPDPRRVKRQSVVHVASLPRAIPTRALLPQLQRSPTMARVLRRGVRQRTAARPAQRLRRQRRLPLRDHERLPHRHVDGDELLGGRGVRHASVGTRHHSVGGRASSLLTRTRSTASLARLPRGDDLCPALIAYCGFRTQGEPTTGAFPRAGGDWLTAGRAGAARLRNGGLILERFPWNGARSQEDLPRRRPIFLPDGDVEAVPEGSDTELMPARPSLRATSSAFPAERSVATVNEFTVRCSSGTCA